MTRLVQDRMDGEPQVVPCKGLNVVDAMYTWFDHSPPKLGGVPSRSEGGAVCSKIARSAHLSDVREALRLINRCASRPYLKGRCATLNRY